MTSHFPLISPVQNLLRYLQWPATFPWLTQLRHLLRCPQWPVSFPWLAQFRHPHSAYLRSNLILSFHLCLVLPSSLFLSRLSSPRRHKLSAAWCNNVLLLRAAWRTRRRLSVFSKKAYLIDNILVFVQQYLWKSLAVGVHIAQACTENFRRPAATDWQCHLSCFYK